MKFLYNFVDELIGYINKSIAAFGITAGVALSFVNVVGRYVFDASLSWAAELTIFFFLWSVFFGAAYCFKKDAHIAVTIILDIVPSKVAKAMLIVSHIITLVFLLAVSYYGYEYLLLVIDLDEMSIDLDIPMWIPYLVIPVAFLFAGFRVAQKLAHIIVTPHEKVLPESEAQMILAEAGKLCENNTKVDDVKLLEEINRKTGGML